MSDAPLLVSMTIDPDAVLAPVSWLQIGGRPP
jgi:hypothetical protein